MQNHKLYFNSEIGEKALVIGTWALPQQEMIQHEVVQHGQGRHHLFHCQVLQLLSGELKNKNLGIKTSIKTDWAEILMPNSIPAYLSATAALSNRCKSGVKIG